MKIINLNEIDESKKNEQSFLNESLDIILSICKQETSFLDKKNLEQRDEEIKSLNESINRQDELLTKSKQLKRNLIEKIKALNSQIENTRNNLLESLGS